MNNALDQLVQEGLIDKAALAQLERYVDLFQEYNSHTNLSAIREKDDIWHKHILDSLMLLQYETLEGTLLDIGTGGGVPGIPLGIAKKSLDVTLLDSVGKKVKACDHFVSELGLQNVHTLRDRAERLGQEASYSHAYDIVTSRATAHLPTILAWSEQFLKHDGRIILYKTPSLGELAAGEASASELNLRLAREQSYTLAGQTRKLLVYTRA